jgi:hypothetical protein
VVFQGRTLYFAASMMLASAFASGRRIRRAERLQALFGVDPRTLRRWQQWWCEAFPASPFFRAASGRFIPPLEASALPRSLLEQFAGGERAEDLLSALLFLAPMTTGSVSFDRTERWVETTRRAHVVTGR